MFVLKLTLQLITSISCRITAVILLYSQGKFNSFNKPSAVSVKHSTALAWISPQDKHILLARSTRLHRFLNRDREENMLSRLVLRKSNI